MKIMVSLPPYANRTSVGSVSLKADDGSVIAGPFDALGKSTDVLAANAGNPTRDPLKKFGDTPTGTYDVAGYVTTGTLDHPSANFGPYGAMLLDPTGGDAAVAKANGRSALMIHGGDLAASGQLKATAGCVRLRNADIQSLLSAISTHEDAALACEMVTVEIVDGTPKGIDDEDLDVTDPPPFSLDEILEVPPDPDPDPDPDQQ